MSVKAYDWSEGCMERNDRSGDYVSAEDYHAAIQKLTDMLAESETAREKEEKWRELVMPKRRTHLDAPDYIPFHERDTWAEIYNSALDEVLAMNRVDTQGKSQ